MSRNIRIAPSILSADFTRLADEIRAVEAAGADMIHFDVMDNEYVPNLTFGPMLCAAVRRLTRLPIDVHLMVRNVDLAVAQFGRAGADSITFHPDATEDPVRTCSLIREHGCDVGMAFKPLVTLHYLENLIAHANMVLVMSVNPGFGGQSFLPNSLARIRAARARIDACGRDVRLQVDGGICMDNIAEVVAAGADTLVAGSAIFGSRDYAATIAALRRRIETGAPSLSQREPESMAA